MGNEASKSFGSLYRWCLACRFYRHRQHSSTAEADKHRLLPRDFTEATENVGGVDETDVSLLPSQQSLQ